MSWEELKAAKAKIRADAAEEARRLETFDGLLWNMEGMHRWVNAGLPACGCVVTDEHLRVRQTAHYPMWTTFTFCPEDVRIVWLDDKDCDFDTCGCACHPPLAQRRWGGAIA